jgi:hypothetical protein
MEWKPQVVRVSVGLESSGYAHQVTNGDRVITVAHHEHRNYDHIHTEPSELGRVYVKKVGVGRRDPDLTPHPDAVKIAAALNSK